MQGQGAEARCRVQVQGPVYALVLDQKVRAPLTDPVRHPRTMPAPYTGSLWHPVDHPGTLPDGPPGLAAWLPGRPSGG